MIEDSEMAAFVCSHILKAIRPVKLVIREDDEWQFLCGEPHPETAIPHVVGLNHLIEKDPSLKPVLELPSNWVAERASTDSRWQLAPLKT